MSLAPHLAYLGFQLFSPAPILRPYIRNYWLIQRQSQLITPHQEFLHGEGGFGIIFNFGDHFAFDDTLIDKKYLLDGANSRSRRMQFHGNVMAIGIRFHISGAYPFFQIPLYELADEFHLLDDLALQMIDSLYEQIINTPDISQKIHALENWLIRRLKKSNVEISDLIVPSLQLLHNPQDDSSIKKIADDLYISQRQLERVFKTQIGITPKQYTRLKRVAHARQLLKSQDTQNMVAIGTQLGYYDQSHFIREFRSIVAMTPHQYMQRNLKRIAAKSSETENTDQHHSS